MRTLGLCFAVAGALAAAGCKKDDKAAAPPPTGSAGSATMAPPAPAPAPGIEIFINDASVAKVTPDQIAKWPRLDTLVPEESRRLGTWATVAIVGTTRQEVKRPSQTYPDMVPALFPGEAGAPAFGMFDPVEYAKHGKPALRADTVREIRLKLVTEGRMGEHQGGTGEGADPTKIVLAIKTAKGDSQLTGAQILALPREAQPGSEDTKGWRLAQLLDAAGIKAFSKLTLLDATGASSVILERKDFDDKAIVPFIKLNKQGALRLRVLKQVGTGWQTMGDLRALASIQVSP